MTKRQKTGSVALIFLLIGFWKYCVIFNSAIITPADWGCLILWEYLMIVASLFLSLLVIVNQLLNGKSMAIPLSALVICLASLMFVRVETFSADLTAVVPIVTSIVLIVANNLAEITDAPKHGKSIFFF